MAAVYPHKSRGYQVRFKLYFPDGSDATKYRYVSSRAAADLLCRDCSFLENRSRSGSLMPREIIQARRDGLLSETEARLLSGGKAVAEYDLDRVMSQFLTTIEVSHTPIAYKKAAGKARWIVDWLQQHPIPNLTETDIKLYILGRRDGSIVYTNPRSTFARVCVRAKTIKNEIDILRGLVDEAVSLGMVETNVAKSVAVPVKTSKLRRSLNRNEISRLTAAALDNKHLLHGVVYEFIMVALYTGYRLAELQMLTWDDINMETHRIFVQSKQIPDTDDFNAKSGEARYKSIADALYPILESMERRGRFVFGGDAPFSQVVLSSRVKLVMKRAGLPGDLSLHHLRHTYGSWLLRITGDLKFVQDEMGHLTLSTTQNYMHNIEDEDDPARTFDYV